MRKLKSIWNKPKYLINKILNHLSIISILFALITITLLILRANNALPFLTTLDFNLPDYYSNNISEIKHLIKKSTTNDEKFEYYKKLLNALNKSTNLHKFYPLINESNKFMIDKLITEGNNKKAGKLAFTWQESYPYDFNAKFKYAEVLKLTNPNQMLLYLQSLFEKHKDIDMVISKYIDALLDNGNFDQALKIATSVSKDLINNANPNFILLLKNQKNNNFSISNAQKVFNKELTETNELYNISFQKQLKKITGLRLIITNLKTNTIISNISSHITANNMVFEDNRIAPISQLSIIQNNFLVKGRKPKFEIILPQQLIDFSGLVKLNLSIKIEGRNKHELNKILHHPKWQFNYSENLEFNLARSKHFFLYKEEDKYITKIELSNERIKNIKIDLPPYKNLNIKNLKMKINGFDIYNLDISKLHHLQKSLNDNIFVKGNKPYLMLKLNDEIIAKIIHIEFSMGK